MERDRLLELLLTDVPAFNDYRRANPTEPADLSHANLGGAKLRQAYLADADLQHAVLKNADLVKANLGGANLRGADLQGADLTDSTLHRADLTGADLRGAKVGAIVGDGRICLHPTCFEGVLYDKEQLEAVLEILNRNRAWEIKYQLLPKG